MWVFTILPTQFMLRHVLKRLSNLFSSRICHIRKYDSACVMMRIQTNLPVYFIVYSRIFPRALNKVSLHNSPDLISNKLNSYMEAAF
jgi:hypothetical protein